MLDPAPAMPQHPSDILDLVLLSERATLELAREIAVALAPGDMVALSGDLGTGKTTFARALIRRLAGDEALEVPSPTFTLMQIYDLPRHQVIHADLYRVNTPEELVELGFADLAADAVAVVEWPDRAAAALPVDRLDLEFSLAPDLAPNERRVRLTAHGALAGRMERMTLMRRFLQEAEFGAAERSLIQGDASTRIYERLGAGDRRAVLVNAPRRAGRAAGARRPARQPAGASRRGRGALRRHGARPARARFSRAHDLCRRHRCRPADRRGSRRRAGRHRRSAGRHRGALCHRRRPAGGAASAHASRGAAGGAAHRSPAGALRRRCPADPGAAVAGLVAAVSRPSGG